MSAQIDSGPSMLLSHKEMELILPRREQHWRKCIWLLFPAPSSHSFFPWRRGMAHFRNEIGKKALSWCTSNQSGYSP